MFLPSRVSPVFLLVPALLLTDIGSSLAQGQKSLTGIWFFDSARKQVYVDSVNAGRRDAPMSEIASAMGLARAEGSLYELGTGSEGPYLSITDKASKVPVVIRVRIEKLPSELVLTALDTKQRFRLRPIDPLHIDLVDEQQRVTIPLTRR